jgi:hypothetical protein
LPITLSVNQWPLCSEIHMKDIIAASPPYLLGIAAAVCLTSAIWLAWQKDKLKEATLLSGLFLLCVVLAYFPQLDSVRAFTMEIKLRKSIDRADEILAQIHKVSVGNAKAMYMTTAWAGRWGGMTAQNKQNILDSVNEQLKASGATDEEIEQITKPLINLIGFDLYNIFMNLVRDTFNHRPIENEKIKMFNDWWDNQLHEAEAISRFENSGSDFTNHLKKMIPSSLFDNSGNEKLEKLAARIGEIFNGCLQREGYTSESIQYLDTYEKCVGRQDVCYKTFVEAP